MQSMRSHSFGNDFVRGNQPTNQPASQPSRLSIRSSFHCVVIREKDTGSDSMAYLFASSIHASERIYACPCAESNGPSERLSLPMRKTHREVQSLLRCRLRVASRRRKCKTFSFASGRSPEVAVFRFTSLISSDTSDK